MHGNLVTKQLLRNTLRSETTNEDSTALGGTHASLNVTHGGKKKTMQHRVMNCVCGDTLRRIEHATRHPILPCKSMHSLDVTHTNITFTRSSQTTDLFTNVNTTNTDSFTHKTTNKTNKNPLPNCKKWKMPSAVSLSRSFRRCSYTCLCAFVYACICVIFRCVLASL